MLAKRIIACLDVDNGRTVKGVHFKSLREAGDPVALGASYSHLGIDELVFLDITATNEKRKTVARLVQRVALEIDIPFTIGGGISSVDDVRILLKSGADKVAINSAAIRDPDLIDRLARAFGSQCIVIAIDATHSIDKWQVFSHGGSRPTNRSLLEWAEECQQRGAGEILFTSMDHDGTKSGFAMDILACLSDQLTIPVVASGGAGTIQHFEEVFSKTKVSAALAASIFHFGIIPVPTLKQQLHERGIPIRI